MNTNIIYEISVEEIKKLAKRREDQDFYMEDGTLIKVWSTEEIEAND
jgi:hypothetical protein